MTEGEMKMWLEALTSMKPSVTNYYQGNIGKQIIIADGDAYFDDEEGEVKSKEVTVKSEEGAVKSEEGAAKSEEGTVKSEEGAVKSNESQPKERKAKTNARTTPTYALTAYGRAHEQAAKSCAAEAYDAAWGTSSTCAYLLRVLQQKGIIDKLGTPAVRLLVHWGLFSLTDDEMQRVADNWNDKLNKLSGDYTQWTIPDTELLIYNSCWECFDERFPGF